jgi:rubrerythrin
MIGRTFAALPRYIEYRCNACHLIFSVTSMPEKCPHCGVVLKEVGYKSIMDEIPTPRV